MPPDTDRTRARLDLRAVRRNFARAAVTTDAHAVLQREVGARMAERLGVVRLEPKTLLDAGCGTGEALVELGVRYAHARRIGVDFALPMLAQAQRRQARIGRISGPARWLRARPTAGSVQWICAAIEALPLARESVDLVWSNFALQWVNEPERALAELGRVLRVGGLLTFSTLGPDTLRELRAAFAGISGGRVHSFIDLHDWGDMLVAAGFADPVMDMEHITLTYPDAGAMMRELKALGAVNALLARPRGLTGRARWERAMRVLAETQRDGKLPATFEIVYGHAWKAQPRVMSDGRAIVRFGTRPQR